MFLSALISEENLVPDDIKTDAIVHLGSDDTGPVITSIELECEVKCEGLSQEKFNELTAASKEKCPISRLVSPTPVSLKARLI
jgi:osmotically inducible protein OsmC